MIGPPAAIQTACLRSESSGPPETSSRPAELAYSDDVDTYVEVMSMPNVVGERYQITIDKKVREKLGVRPGDQAYEFEEDGRLVVTFIRPHDESLLGILKRYSDEPDRTDHRLGRGPRACWVARSAEIMEALRAGQPPSRR